MTDLLFVLGHYTAELFKGEGGGVRPLLLQPGRTQLLPREAAVAQPQLKINRTGHSMNITHQQDTP